MILLMLAITLITLVVSGLIIYQLRENEIREQEIQHAAERVKDLGQRTESMLQSVEQSLITYAEISNDVSKAEFSQLLLDTVKLQPLIRSMYFLDAEGRSFAVWKPGIGDPQNPDLIGIDFSYTPLFKQLDTQHKPVWSDKFVSALAGDISVGVGVRAGNHLAIAEINLNSLLKVVESFSHSAVRIGVIDRIGEVLVDTKHPENAGSLNLQHEPIMELIVQGNPLPEAVRFAGGYYHPGAYRSQKLGWLFLAGVSAGLDNPKRSDALTIILLCSGAFLIIAVFITPLWSYFISSHIVSLRRQAETIASGEDSAEYRKGSIREFNELSDYLQLMGGRIRKREGDLKELNQQLEQRVAERTAELESSNSELKESLDTNTKMQALLVQTEKMAALGRLVAGVAHELNTPIGNAVMTISTLRDELRQINVEMEKGLRKSSLDYYLDQNEQGLKIAERNVERAAELISSFKHVASDQTSSVRRKFGLSAMVDDVLLTLHPTLKRSPHRLDSAVEKGLTLDSYPGVVGQILTNLIANALLHAWDDGQRGVISVVAGEAAREGWVRISVADDGKGIPEELHDKVFDPFFTTKMGQGGTGLGLNIAYNGAVNILGGELRFENGDGGGAIFILEIPLVAPVMDN